MPLSNEWTCYRAVFDAASPIHIGWHALGLIRRTRYYIPARNVWGAVVAGLAPVLCQGQPIATMYTECAKHLDEWLRFTCLFPASSSDGRPLLPDYDPERGFLLGDKPPEDFEWRFVFSQTSAALNPETLTAEDGALHESEYLSPIGRKQLEKLSFVGYFLLKTKSLEVESLKLVLANLRVGSDRNYGWGWLKLRDWMEIKEQELFGAYTVSFGSTITNKGEGPIPAHVAATANGVAALCGAIDVLKGREWCSERGSGQKFSDTIVAWAPGSRFPDGTRFTINATGLWTRAT